MTINLDAIEKAAREATPGPWEVSDRGKSVGAPGFDGAGVAFCYRTHTRDDREEKANAHYIATMDPQTTLALVERVRELEAMESRLHETIADYEFLRRGYTEMGDFAQAEMFAERIAQIETAMRGY